MVITVSCPSCAASFPVDSNKIPAGGVKVRCSACSEIFRIDPPVEPEEPQPSTGEVAVAEPEPEVAPEPEPAPEAPAEEAEESPSLDTSGLETEPVAVDDAPVSDRHLDDETGFSVGTEEPAATDEGEGWVIEQEEQIDPGSIEIEPMDTVESTMAAATHEAESEPVMDPGSGFHEPAPVEDEAVEVAPEPEATAPEPEPAAAEAPAVAGFTFGRRDPKEKARRLARVLVSDMIMYNPERHERALANGTLKEDFEDEIAKSWKEYVEQVGEEMATENPFWTEALNDVLAKGQEIF